MITVTNTSEQRVLWHYRVPGRNQYSVISLGSGRQDQIDRENRFSAEETEAVIKQLQKHGARSKEDLKNKPDSGFHGLVYSLGKPLTETQIHDGHDKMMDGREQLAARESVRAALGQDIAINGDARKGGKRRSRETQVEVIEAPSDDPKRRGSEIHMNLTISPEGRDLRLPGN